MSLHRFSTVPRYGLAGVLIIALGLVGACAQPNTSAEMEIPPKPVVLDDTVAIATGQTVYVPIYSHIFMWEQTRRMDLTATLSVRNTDQVHPIIITAVRYYDSNGELVREYLEQPVELGTLAATSFVVQQDDQSGGVGASFIVEWVAQTEVSDPVIEAIMINTAGNQGVSFVSPGRVIKSQSTSQ